MNEIAAIENKNNISKYFSNYRHFINFCQDLL